MTSASTGVPIPFAQVEVYHGVSYIGIANANFQGRYSIALPSDSYSFEVAAPGWSPIGQGAVVPAAPALTLNFQLVEHHGQRVYRFFNTRTGTHFYSASDAEFINVYSKLASVYRYDGVAYSVDLNPAYPTKPLYRFFNVKNGVHFYTANEAERANVQANLSPERTFTLRLLPLRVLDDLADPFCPNGARNKRLSGLNPRTAEIDATGGHLECCDGAYRRWAASALRHGAATERQAP